MYLGVAPRGKIDIGLAVGKMPTAEPERHVLANRLSQLKFRTHDYFLSPLADQISDKLCATPQLYGPSGLPSSREKDLVDLAMIAAHQAVDAAELRVAIAHEFRLRGLEMVDRFSVPPGWGAAYRLMAARTPLADRTPRIEDALALALVGTFLDPVLDGSVDEDRWDPKRGSCVPPG